MSDDWNAEWSQLALSEIQLSQKTIDSCHFPKEVEHDGPDFHHVGLRAADVSFNGDLFDR
jgi:hypothetical protein